MKKNEIFIEGKTKKLYNTDNNDQLVLEFLNTIYPAGSKQKTTYKNKAEINSEIASYLFEYLESYNVPTHYIRKIDNKSLLIRKLEVIPIRMCIWNVATDSLAKRLGLKDGSILETPVLELYLKNDKLKNPLINDYHAYTLKLCDRSEMSSMIRIGTKVNAVLKSFFIRKDLTLALFSLEFGRANNQIMLANEITPDNLVLGESKDTDQFDKKVFTITSSNAKDVYPKLRDIILS